MIALIFSLFDRIGTVGGVLAYLADYGSRSASGCGKALTRAS